MDEIHNTEQMMTDEIDLRELFMVFWKKKILIICITLISAILTGVISVFFIKPVYHSRLNIIINMPEKYLTKYGEYTLPITSNEQYINLITSSEILAHTILDMGYEDMTIEALRDRITVDIPETKNNVKQNSFFIKVASDNPQEAKELAQALFNNYYEFIDLMTVEGAVDYYINKYSVDLASLEVTLNTTKETLAKNEALLAQTPQTINQKEAMSELYNNPGVSDYVILENIINPNYTKIESNIIENKQTINNIENNMAVYNQYLDELNAVKEKIADYKSNGNWDVLNDEFKSIAKTNIYLPSEPIVPSRKSSPNNMRNVLIGAVLGGMVAVVVVFIKEFWFTSK